jgi:hypothetical protein
MLRCLGFLLFPIRDIGVIRDSLIISWDLRLPFPVEPSERLNRYEKQTNGNEIQIYPSRRESIDPDSVFERGHSELRQSASAKPIYVGWL